MACCARAHDRPDGARAVAAGPACHEPTAEQTAAIARGGYVLVDSQGAPECVLIADTSLDGPLVARTGLERVPGPIPSDVSARIVDAEVLIPRARSDERPTEGGVMHPHVLERAIALVRHSLRHADLATIRHERDDALDEQRRSPLEPDAEL